MADIRIQANSCYCLNIFLELGNLKLVLLYNNIATIYLNSALYCPGC